MKSLAEEMQSREFRQAFNSDQLRVHVAMKLRRLRERKGLTQTAVSRTAGLVQSQIARAEHPDRGMTLDQLVKVADGLGLVPEVVFRKPRRDRS